MKISVEKLHSYTGHKDCVYTISPSGRKDEFFSAGGDGMVVKWNLLDAANGTLIARVSSSVYAMHYIESYNRLIIGQNFEGLHIIDLNTNKVIKSAKITTSSIFDIKSCTRKAYIGTGDGMVIAFDLDNLVVLKQIKVSGKSIRSIAINEATNEMAIGASDNNIKIIDLGTLDTKKILEGHQSSVFSVVYSPGQKYLISGGRDAHLKVWDATEGYSLYKDIVAHMYTINNIAYNESGKLFATCSMDKSIKVWDAKSFSLLKVIDKARYAGHGTSVNKLFWAEDNQNLISCSDDKTVSIWEIGY